MVLAAIEAVVQVVASVVLEADSEEASGEEASQAVGNPPCKPFKTPTCYSGIRDLPVKRLKRFIRDKSRNKGKKPGMLVYFKLSP